MLSAFIMLPVYCAYAVGQVEWQYGMLAHMRVLTHAHCINAAPPTTVFMPWCTLPDPTITT
jgi:hypothetical protein